MKPKPPLFLKAWKMNVAERMGLSLSAVNNRLRRGKIRYPRVVRLNKRTILVMEVE